MTQVTKGLWGTQLEGESTHREDGPRPIFFSIYLLFFSSPLKKRKRRRKTHCWISCGVTQMLVLHSHVHKLLINCKADN